MSRHVWRMFKSIRAFGFANGFSFYARYAYHRLFKSRKWALRKTRLNGISQPIWLRPGVSDWIAVERIFMDREYDPMSKSHDAAMDRLHSEIVSSGKRPLIIDCGANIGLSSVWFSERFSNAMVVAIEPESGNFKILTLTAKNFANVRPVNAAISNNMSYVALSNDGDVPWAWRTHETAGSKIAEGGVAAITIPHVIALYPDCTLTIVKVDIEGFETQLLDGETDWVDDLPLLVFEMHDWMLPWSGSGHAFFSTLGRRKRDYLIQGENIFSYSHQALSHRALA